MVEFWNSYGLPTAIIVLQIVAILVPLLVSVAYLTYFERKVIGAMQIRKGPNVVGPFGLLQPFADGLKLLLKETVLPIGANKVVFIIAPLLTFTLSLVAWAVIPFGAVGNGDMVCFDYRNSSDPTIVLWKHERAFSSTDCLIPVADSFEAMIKRAIRRQGEPGATDNPDDAQ